ncbi:MAG: DEAD/DEAH box helicase family protein, partial [Candidatus Accumulibacter sp.]|nr:DEAD/DEAH box helicase family protein [Accumulibacter sp.]
MNEVITDDSNVIPGETETILGDVIKDPNSIALSDFVTEFGDELLDALNTANPPVYTGQARAHRQAVLDGLKRKLFPAQAQVVHAVAELLLNQGERAAIINAEMGTGKTCMSIAAAAVLHAEGFSRAMVLSPPHLVYKWRREILETVPNAKVWVLNGPDTLAKLLKLRAQIGMAADGPEFFILGRVRMRMGFHWRPSFARLRKGKKESIGVCPRCGEVIADQDGNPCSVAALEAE